MDQPFDLGEKLINDKQKSMQAARDEAAEERRAIVQEGKGAIRPAPQAKPLACGRTVADLEKRFSAKVEYLWRQYLADGMPSMMNGREGDGKSTIALAIIIEILAATDAGMILWVASEGQINSTVKQAVELGLADKPRFVFAEKATGDFVFDFTKEYDIRAFAALMDQLSQGGRVLLVVVDSIRGITPWGDEDSKIGKVMHRLNAIVCDRHGAALLYIDHHKKGKTEKDNPHHLLDKNSGSTSKTSAVRMVLSVLPVSRYKRVIRVAKSNLGHQAGDLEVIKLNDRIVFKEPEEMDDETVKERAEQLLVDLFSEQATWLAKDVYKEGEKKGIGSDSLKRAKNILRIQSFREGEAWFWKWSI